MINLRDKDIEWYRSSGELEKIEAVLNDYWDNSRKLESEAIIDLEKHLWIVNSTAATLLIAYLQTKEATTNWQAFSAASFILEIVFLFFLKYVSAYNSSRVRSRFETAKSKFQAGEATDFVFKTVRDRKFSIVKSVYTLLQIGSGFLFVAGLVLLLAGIWPQP
jgi:hypothetical protein